MNCSRFLLCVLGPWIFTAARADRVTLFNPTKTDYVDEAVRLPLSNSTGAGTYRVTLDGREIPCQPGVSGNERKLWILATLEAGARKTYLVEREKPSGSKPLVSVTPGASDIILDNGLVAVKTPASWTKGSPPAPILAVRVGGRWIGEGGWHTDRALRRFTSEVTGRGPIFARVKLKYIFEGKGGLYRNAPAFAEVVVTVFAGQRHAVLEETHEMGRGDRWEFDCAAGWTPRHAICIPHGGGFGRPDLGPWPPDSLKTGQTRMSDRLLNLMPRWTQAYDEGWFFACHDGVNAVGAMACRAGRWHWPHSNRIEVKVKKSADYGGLICPTWKGRRFWLLVAGPADTWKESGARAYVSRHAFYPLDRIVSEFDLRWPGPRPPGGFSRKDFYSSGMNPTGAMRGFGRSAMRQIEKPATFGTLTEVQNLLSNDAYGSYWNFWSPENPNFFTDYIRGPITHTMRLRGNPQFRELAKLAELKFREDLYHSITLPGGAGQECPGYVAHAMGSWSALADPCRKYLGFDPRRWPRFQAGASFLLHLSQPIAPGVRRCHPGGDTHPPGPDVLALAEEIGVIEDVQTFKTEELPGFGAVFRHRPGTDRETYLAFKSGPNRGHFHGDQLSFHYCADSRQVAIDHMCSYAPRAGQEHMHNRVAFHTDKLPHANMDGHERLIAFKSSARVDIAMGQVESERLRYTTEYPPEGWDVYLPQQVLDPPLRYRRTIVAVKGESDYFVVRDQHAGPDIVATYCLHVLTPRCERRGNTIHFGNLTLFCARPGKFQYGRHDWEFEKKDRKGNRIIREHTRGVRLTASGAAGEFITVLYPGNRPPSLESIEGGVRVGMDDILFSGGIDDEDSTDYVTVTRRGNRLMTLTGKDIDRNRFQGEVGLFVPDAGYPFGEIPDWLIQQRATVPDWAPAWVKQHRKYDLPEGE